MKELTREDIEKRLIEKGYPYPQLLISELANVGQAHVCNVFAGRRTSQRITNIISVLLGESIAIKRQNQRRKAKPVHIKQSLKLVEDTKQ